MIEVLTLRKLLFRVVVGLMILALVMCLCASFGSERISLLKVIEGLRTSDNRNVDYQIFFAVRVPRVILASLVGAALACCGGVLQAILRNPLADPYILGISSGAGLGATVALLCGLDWALWAGSAVTIPAFLGAILTVWLVWFIGHLAGKSQMMSLLLAGVVVNAFFSSVIMFLMSVAGSEQLRATTLWLMGNITEKNVSTLVFGGAAIIIGILALFTVSQRLNVLSFGEHEAVGLGVNVGKVRLFSFAVSAFVTAVAVGLSGLVGFVGLIVPHAVRLVFGPDHRQLLPLSAIIGAVFVVIADTIARTIIAPAQLPVGVVTAIAGGPFFLVLLGRFIRRVSWLK